MGAILIIVLIVGTYFFSGDDSSYFNKSSQSISRNASKKDESQESESIQRMFHASQNPPKAPIEPTRNSEYISINYKAQQVLVREGADVGNAVPIGSNFIGKTLTSVDTREAGALVKVLLPYGGQSKDGGTIPKNTIIFGAVSSKDEKLYIQFSKGLFPDGKEFVLEAVALSSADYSPGIAGNYHSTEDMKVAATLGLTFVSGMTDTLTQRESLGDSFETTPKATVQNALYHGASEVAQNEATREAGKINQAADYVTLPAGSDLIVSLTKALVL